MKRKCPGNMKRNQVITNPENPGQKVKVIGFTGFPGFRYHPTKGLRKDSGFDHIAAKVVI